MEGSLVSHQFGLSAISDSHRLPQISAPLAQSISAAVLILFSVAVPLPTRDSPRTLHVRERFGQVLISWTPGQDGRLDINDDGLLTRLTISRHLTNVTYSRHHEEVEIRLTDPEGRLAPQLARFITCREWFNITTHYQKINGLIAETRHLRLNTRNQRAHTRLIQMAADLLLDRTALVARRMHVREK